MRKFLLLFILIGTTVSSVYSQEYEVRHAPYHYRNYYVLDRTYSERETASYLGIVTRFGYSFSDNGYFSYGASVYYTFNSIIGITAGFDGFAGTIYVYDNSNNIVQYYGPYSSLPMWDIRAGVTLGKYVSIGPIYGRCNICKTDLKVVHKYNNNGTYAYSSGGFWGIFASVMAPISTHLSLNFDMSYTTHTSFTLTAGLIYRIQLTN